MCPMRSFDDLSKAHLQSVSINGDSRRQGKIQYKINSIIAKPEYKNILNPETASDKLRRGMRSVRKSCNFTNIVTNSI